MKSIQIKPFVKWAGGKSQLINEIKKNYPKHLGVDINKYAEPFIGGGAVLFNILSNYELESVYISDTNAELINTYLVIQEDVNSLIEHLFELQSTFIALEESARKTMYYNKRAFYNDLQLDISSISIEKAALFIFLNKTCFNGLYRVNSKGEFNVPMGSYKNPCICDDLNLKNISDKLSNVNILCADYKASENFIDHKTFVYFDPPYRPLSSTSNFTSYTEVEFGDKEQTELAKFIDRMTAKGAKIVLSNSNPKNTDETDDFFDELYMDFKVNRIKAMRMINSNKEKRGKINELLIVNY